MCEKFVVKTLNQQLSERLLLEVLGRYNSVRTNIHYQLLNLDIRGLLQYCRAKRLTLTDRMQNIRRFGFNVIKQPKQARDLVLFLLPVFKHSQENTGK